MKNWLFKLHTKYARNFVKQLQENILRSFLLEIVIRLIVRCCFQSDNRKVYLFSISFHVKRWF